LKSVEGVVKQRKGKGNQTGFIKVDWRIAFF
jgi:hypothetical protein